MRLSRGTEWNDLLERTSFSTAVDGFIRFGKCFSFSRSENLAMWMLYGGMNKSGAMLNLTKTTMNSILAQTEFELGYRNSDNAFTCVERVSIKDECKISLIDVLYCDEKDGIYTIKRSDERVEGLKKLPGDKRIILKSYPWSYENEVRLVLEIPKTLVPKQAECVCLPLNCTSNELKNRTYAAPNNNIKGLGFCQSKLKGTVDWDICCGCTKKIDTE